MIAEGSVFMSASSVAYIGDIAIMLSSTFVAMSTVVAYPF
jgi:hypothetical protein